MFRASFQAFGKGLSGGRMDEGPPDFRSVRPGRGGYWHSDDCRWSGQSGASPV